MNMHKNAQLTPLGRERIVRQVESGQTPEAVSEAAGVCPRTPGPFVATASAAPADTADCCRRDRTVAPPALDGQADRCRDRRLASYCQSCSASDRLE